MTTLLDSLQQDPRSMSLVDQYKKDFWGYKNTRTVLQSDVLAFLAELDQELTEERERQIEAFGQALSNAVQNHNPPLKWGQGLSGSEVHELAHKALRGELTPETKQS